MRFLLSLLLSLSLLCLSLASPVLGARSTTAASLLSGDELRAQLASASHVDTVQMKHDFVQWIAHQRAVYSADEFEYRSLVFFSNWLRVQQHNAEADRGMHSWRMGLTKFADRTVDEYRSMLKASASLPAPTLTRPDGTTAVLAGGASGSRVFTPSSDQVKAVPAAVDWRTENVVTPIKDQGQCGSCWTFSATGNMEGVHAWASKSLVSLSEEEWVDCLQNATGCDGGWMNWAFEAAIAMGGAMTEADYPYVGSNGNKCAFNASKVAASFTSYLNVTEGDETGLTTAAAIYPTVSVAIDASHESFQLYESGVYVEPECAKGVDDLDHAVLVVGYGSEAVNSTTTLDYYIVKNSWGTNWGQDGYIWMGRNMDNQCGIATRAMFILV